jgi:hypothetical protein
MRRPVGAAAVLAAACVFCSVDIESTTSSLDAAALAWDRGDYVTALTTYQQLLDSPDADRVLEPIALQTGELFRTTELTRDGSNPQFSPDGRFITYETGTGPSRVTRLLPADGTTKPISELPGFGASFSQDGSRIAYLNVVVTDSLKNAYAEFERAPQTERAQRATALNTQAASQARIVLRDLATGAETGLNTGAIRTSTPLFTAGSTILFAGTAANDAGQQIYSVAPGKPARALTSDAGEKAIAAVTSTGNAVLFSSRQAGPGRGGGPTGRGGNYSVLSVADGDVHALNTPDRPAFSADGRTIAFVSRERDEYRLEVAAARDLSNRAIVAHGIERLDAPTLSADGSRVAYQKMAGVDWEIFFSNREGTGEQRITREIQHDLLPQFLSPDRLLGVIGEPRHRRSYVYDLASGTRLRLFHNNTIRTIAPEYSWTPSPDGTKLLISAERDGDTVSPERGVYLIDLTKKVTRDEVRERILVNLNAERALRAKGQRLYAPIAADVKAVVADASVARVYGYEKSLFDFDSKHITRPGNKLASAYLFDTYKSFGYEPQFQWFEPRAALDGRTANVVATLTGTVNPELVYVVSSHYDSVAVGPGADDDSSGTAALLETARILATHPQPATIMFASFTGEEAGLLGSREFVRRAVADKVKIVGALNNDMVGWANDHRLDNTIRYSNPGIRDAQHGAAMQFTNLITYDALYYKGTDAMAYYEAYGDIVGGIGSYPVLGSPHYHQPHDVLETINHQLVTEVAKTTAATLMLLASSPSRLTNLEATLKRGAASVSWQPSPEKNVTGYLVMYGPPAHPDAQQIKVAKPSATLMNVAPGTVVAVKAINSKGLEGWDWARVTIK